MVLFFDRKDNTMGKGENAGYLNLLAKDSKKTVLSGKGF